MNARNALVRIRCLGVALVACATALPLGLTLASLLGRPAEPTDPGGQLVRICAGLLLMCLVWAWAAVLASVVDAWQGASARELAGVPPWLRRLVLLGCGVALAGGITAPGHAVGEASSGGVAGAAMLAGLPMPDRATDWAAPATAPEPASSAVEAPVRPPGPHTIAPGETLWGIAAASLDPDAPPEAVEARWREIHRVNRAVIGDDPDLIHPGDRLVLPEEGAAR